MPRTSDHTPSLPQRQVADLWNEEVVPHLPGDLAEHARILGAFQRRRAVASATDLLRAVLASVLIATSLQHLGAWAVLADVADISAPAWQKRLQKCRAWLAWVLNALLTPPPTPLPMTPSADGNIFLVDATRLAQVGGDGDDWRLHMAYQLNAGRLAQITLTDQSGGEHLGYYCLQPGAIVVADGGYGYRRSVAIVRKQQAHVVTRIRPATFPFETRTGVVIDIVSQLRKQGPSVREWGGWCTDADAERYPVRLLVAALPPAAAAAARRRARQNAQRHGRTVQPATLFAAGWVLLITTLDATRWSAADVLALYRARWQIELVFKRMKSILAMGTLRGRTVASLTVTILALLVAWALQEQEARWVRHQLAQLTTAAWRLPSSWTLTVMSLDLLRQQVRGHWGQARFHACLVRLERFFRTVARWDREHQETAIRDWLAQRPRSRFVVREAAA